MEKYYVQQTGIYGSFETQPQPSFRRIESSDHIGVESKYKIPKPFFYTGSIFDENEAAAPILLQELKDKTFSKAHALQQACVLLSALFLALFFLQTFRLSTNLAARTKALAIAKQTPAISPEQSETPTEPYQHALTTDLVPIDTLTHLEVTLPSPHRNFKKMLRVEANDFRRNTLGSIKNLRVLITNRSDVPFKGVKLQVIFLDNTGQQVQLDTFEIHDLRPGQSQGIAVPTGKSAMKVSYKVTQIEPQYGAPGINKL